MRQRNQSDTTRSGSVVLISDFTPAMLRELEQVREAITVKDIRCEPVIAGEPADNAAILGARIAGMADDALTVDVTVRHYGPADRPCTVIAEATDLGTIGKQEFNLSPPAPMVVRLQIDLGPEHRRRGQPCVPIELMLSPADGLQEDNTYHLVAYVPVAARTHVVLVHEAQETFLFETAVQALAGSGALRQATLIKVPQGKLTSRQLDRADIAVFACIPPSGSYRVSDLKAFTQKGGKLVFFSTQDVDTESASLLSREGLLAAQPEKWMEAVSYPQPQPCAEASLALDEQAARSLRNYRLDQVALKGFWRCRPAANAECLWRLNAGEGLLYAVPCGRGLSILVNTSIDDSLGLLAKSAAWVAFCRYLMGQSSQVQQFCFTCEERPVLHAPALDADPALRRPRAAVMVEHCDGQAGRAAVQGNVLVMPVPVGLGWMKTTDGPTLYAGINLPAGETDLTAPTEEAVAAAVQRVFVAQREMVGTARPASADLAAHTFRDKPIWPVFAWAAILLLLIESTVANRFRR